MTAARIAATLTAASVVVALAAPGAQALAPDPEAPVVTNDAVEIYPSGMAVVDVLANDVDPGDPDGSQLALCRLPSLDLDGIVSASDLPPVVVGDAGGLFGSQGEMVVLATRSRLARPTVVDYYVCNTTRLTPATLTVTMRATKPVTVRKVPGKPGRLKVTNHNDRRIMWTWSARRSGGGGSSVPAHATRIVHVHATKLQWIALIGGERSSGIADSGVVRNVKLDPHDDDKPTKGHPHLPIYFRALLERLG